MFFRQIRRSAAKNRKNNSLFFGTLVAAIVAFYTLLSLESQDVIRFLKTLESDAIERLMLLIPVVYAVSLFFVFFLVYFAYRYQMDGRRKEFGLYLMLGMGRGRLFAMLMGETLWNSLVSILTGLPIALLLTEGISLATAKVIGLGIVGHEISLSFRAVDRGRIHPCAVYRNAGLVRPVQPKRANGADAGSRARTAGSGGRKEEESQPDSWAPSSFDGLRGRDPASSWPWPASDRADLSAWRKRNFPGVSRHWILDWRAHTKKGAQPARPLYLYWQTDPGKRGRSV